MEKKVNKKRLVVSYANMSQALASAFKEKYPNSVVYSFRFIAEDINSPIVSTLARQFPDAVIQVLHVSIVITKEGNYVKINLQIIGDDELQENVKKYLNANYNVTTEVI